MYSTFMVAPDPTHDCGYYDVDDGAVVADNYCCLMSHWYLAYFAH